MAEEKLVKIVAGLPKPTQRRVYRKLGKARLRLKKNYLLARANGEKNAIGDFLSSIGYNVSSSTMKGRTDEYEVSRDKNLIENDDDHDSSNWIVQNENSVLEELDNQDVYNQRKIGEKNKPWIGKKCPSCKAGFKNRSATKKCHGCDSFTHNRQSCVKFCSDKSQFYCKICKPIGETQVPNEETQRNDALIKKVDGNFKCGVCGLVAKSKYSARRHMDRKHKNVETETLTTESVHESACASQPESVPGSLEETAVTIQAESPPSTIKLGDVLESVGLEDFENVFISEHIDMEMLLDLGDEELMDMFRSIGIGAWGLRHNLKRALQDIKKKNQKTANDDKQVDVEYSPNVHEINPPQELILSEPFSSFNSAVSNTEDTLVEGTFDGHLYNILDATEDDANTSELECPVCRDSSQHHCRKCWKLVCNLYCSVQDPTSDNVLHLIHKPGDSRCSSQNFECPNCGSFFTSPGDLQSHMELNHTQLSSLSLVSEASSEIERLLQEEDDNENDSFSSPVFAVSKRIKQNINLRDLENFSDEEDDWNPTDDEILDDLFSCVECDYTTRHEKTFKQHMTKHMKKSNPKRKTVPEKSSTSKQIKQTDGSSLTCETCGQTFSRKDSLKRHIVRKH